MFRQFLAWLRSLFPQSPSAQVIEVPQWTRPESQAKPSVENKPQIPAELPKWEKKMGYSFAVLKPRYEYLWSKAELSVPEWLKNEYAYVRTHTRKNRTRYDRVSGEIGIPWKLLAGLHAREASFDFQSALHNGDRVIGNGKLTWRVPSGRGPFATWEDAAADAIKYELELINKNFGPFNPTEWTVPEQLYFAEAYNGFGYLQRGENSPYVWSGTNNYKGYGRYVADHKYDPNSREDQIGVASILIDLNGL